MDGKHEITGEREQAAMGMDLSEAMTHFARKRTPIHDAAQMPEEWKQKIICTPPDPEWQGRIKELPWSQAYGGNDPLPDDEREMQKKILTFGGFEVCIPGMEEDVAEILAYGQLWNGWTNTILMKGEPCHCHSNASRLFRSNIDNPDADLTVATGYALSADGLWRQHSWIVERRKRSIRIIETTSKRLLYFGAALSSGCLKRFLRNN